MGDSENRWIFDIAAGLKDGSMSISVEKARGAPCGRCRMYREDTGFSQKWTDICERCARVIEADHAKDKYLVMVYLNGELLHFAALEEEEKQKFLTFFYDNITKPRKEKA